MPEMHVLFIPWPRSLGAAFEVYSAAWDNVQFMDPDIPKEMRKTAELPADEELKQRMRTSPVAFRNPERPLTNDGLEYELKNKEWLKEVERKGKTYHEVWYTGKISPILFSMMNGVIYVRGHGETGRETINSGKSALPYQEVVKRLLESGLQRRFAGKIKCYNCHSGEGGKDAFAQKFADELYGILKDDYSCQVIGYEGALDSFPDPGKAKQTLLNGRSQPARLHRVPFQPRR